jgi:sugar lactone lactonase YvrE/4-amino-4-deoxy-L-arabinose transferase-like glycosyltransferase
VRETEFLKETPFLSSPSYWSHMSQRTIRPFLLGALAVLLACAGQQALRADVSYEAVLLYSVGGLLFVGALWRPIFFPDKVFAFPTGPLPNRHARRVWLAAGLLVVAVIFAVLAWRSFDAEYPRSLVAWQQHLASIVFALAAACSLDFWNASKQPPEESALRSKVVLETFWNWVLSCGAAWKAWGALGLILLLAAVLRLLWLDTLPFGVWYDEAEYGLQALRILNDSQYRPVFEGAINGPAHYLYLVASSFGWFGVSAASIRLVSAGFGVLTVLAGYLVGSELFGRRVGLVLAFLLAVSSWLITLSRLGMHSTTTTPFFTLVTIAFVLRALRTGRVSEFALAGLWLGLGLCFYTSFRLFVPVVALFLLYSAFHQWRRTHTWPTARFWVGVAAFGVMATLAVVPLVWFAGKQPDIFWSRVQDTYLFTGKNEAERLPALLGNIQKHVLMFNWHGDPNGRHNLPGAPMLDDITAALAVLGLVYSLRRVCDPRFALLPVWLAATLLGGILSLDFEAPQSLRANGSLGVAYVLAIVPVAVLARAWRVGDGHYYPNWVWWPLASLLALAAWANINTYFVKQATDFSVWAAHSAAETLTAGLLKSLDGNADAFVTSYYNGHPTLRFLLPTGRPYATLETTDQLPLDFAPGKGALLVMGPESHAQYDAAKRLYPGAQFEEVMPPMAGPPVLYTVRLSPEDVASVQGLDGRYFANASWEGQPAFVTRDAALRFDWTTAPLLPEPFSAEWAGVLHVETYGAHDFVLQSPGQAELLIGEQQVLTGTGVLSGSLTLAEGNHALRVRARAGPGLFQLRWRTPDRSLEVVGAGSLYAAPVTANGLLARYFANGDWQGPEVRARIEEQMGYYVHVPPLPRPYTVEYTGKIAIPVTGSYRFGLESIDESILSIDGREVVRATQPNHYEEGGLVLEDGWHDIRIQFADRTGHTHLNVYWMPPGAARVILPSAVLFPPQGSYADVEMPTLASLVQTTPLLGPTSPAPELPGNATIFATGLQQPRGIGVAEDGRVYVAEGAGGKVTIFSPQGEIVGRIPHDADVLAEPSDVALDSEHLYVLDAGEGRLWQYALDGSEAQEIQADPMLLDRSRGLAKGPDGRVWAAATAAGLVAGINLQDGTDDRMAMLVDGKVGQPVDAAVAADGVVYATDASLSKLVRLTPAGRPERTWPLPAANSLNGPHLAFDAFGHLYVTEPEGGRVEKRDPGGAVVGVWNVAGLLNQSIKAVGLAVGLDGRIWVTDSDGGTVVVVEPTAD